MGDILRETRNRSRSKTPFLRSQCDNESCAHAGEEGHSHQHHHEKKKKTPNVQTITEEVVEVTSKSPKSAEKTKQSSSKTVSSTTISSSSSSSASKAIDIGKAAKTSDYSSEDASPETFARIARLNNAAEGGAQVSSFSSSSVTTRTVITSSGQLSQGNKNVKSLRSAPLTSTPKAFLQQQNFSFDNQKQSRQADGLETSTQLDISSNNNNSSSKKSFKEQTNGSFSDHVAYKEYKDAGEYWNKFPKTDYTYSKRSPHRREICPGVIAMPNMSRCSLENHHDRVTEMIQRSPAQEEYIRKRYAYQTTASPSNNSYNRRAAEKLIYDSHDEVDMAQFESYRKNKRYLSSSARSAIQTQTWYNRVYTSIVTTFYSLWSVVSGGNSSENDLYRTRIAHEERGFLGHISHGVSSVFIGLFRYIYLAISTVLSLDTWLLKSSNAENNNKKRFLLLLLILLPLLLLSGLYYYLNPNEPFPPRSLSEITYTLPNLDLTEFYNQEKLDAMKTSAYNGLDDLRDYTHEYFSYLKQVSMNILDEAWGLLEDKERQTRLDTVYNFLPLTLAGLRQSFSSLDLRNLFIRPNIESSQYNKLITDDTLTSNLKNSLSPEEYENIFNHVNIYVQKLVDAKLEQQKQYDEQNTPKQQNTVSKEMLVTIADTIRESIQKLEPILVKKTQSDVFGEKMMQRIVENVKVDLRDSEWSPTNVPAVLSEDHIRQISQMIRENIEINNHQYNIVEKIDIDGLLLKVLKSPQLATFVDSRILLAKQESSEAEKEVIARQELIINELNKEIEFIKATLSDKLSENQDLHYSIGNLKLSQDNLLKRFDSHESLVSNRFDALLAEIEEKLSLLRSDQFVLINKQVKSSIIDILGYKASGEVENVDLRNWIRNTFVAKELLEQRLSELSAQSSNEMKREIDRSGMILMKQISEKLKIEILRSVDMKQKQSAAAISGEIKMALSENEIEKIVRGVLAVYDADKTGLVDYALESAGGQILSTRCTENYPIKSAQISIFGIPLWYPANTPRIAISPNVQPGECWAFQGFPGFLVLRLNSLIHVTGFTLEHIPKTLTPNGKIDSAPRNFTTWGLEHENDHEPVLLGEYEYQDNDQPLQYFPVQQDVNGRLFDIVEMRIETNHGNTQYTCLYRFRVHGKPPVLDV